MVLTTTYGHKHDVPVDAVAELFSARDAGMAEDVFRRLAGRVPARDRLGIWDAAQSAVGCGEIRIRSLHRDEGECSWFFVDLADSATGTLDYDGPDYNRAKSQLAGMFPGDDILPG